MTLEKKINTLENIMNKMESESTDLNQTVDEYSKAIKLAAEIVKSLKTVESKITIIQKEQQKIKETIQALSD